MVNKVSLKLAALGAALHTKGGGDGGGLGGGDGGGGGEGGGLGIVFITTASA